MDGGSSLEIFKYQKRAGSHTYFKRSMLIADSATEIWGGRSLDIFTFCSVVNIKFCMLFFCLSTYQNLFGAVIHILRGGSGWCFFGVEKQLWEGALWIFADDSSVENIRFCMWLRNSSGSELSRYFYFFADCKANPSFCVWFALL